MAFSLPLVLIIGLVYLAVGALTASVGATSLFTVPFLIALGVSPRVAVATNMFALVFHSIGGAWGFRAARRGISVFKLVLLIVITVIGSSLGALLVVEINENLLEILIALFAGLMAVTLLLFRDVGIKEKKRERGVLLKSFGVFFVFLSAIYGGFFSGGYVTVLSYLFVMIFGYNFLQAAYLSKVLNICSSTIAAGIFFYSGIIDFTLGVVMAGAFLIGSYGGARYALAKGNAWIRKLFIFVILVLAAKLFFF